MTSLWRGFIEGYIRWASSPFFAVRLRGPEFLYKASQLSALDKERVYQLILSAENLRTQALEVAMSKESVAVLRECGFAKTGFKNRAMFDFGAVHIKVRVEKEDGE